MRIGFARLWKRAPSHDETRPIKVVRDGENVWRIVWADDIAFQDKAR